MSLKDAKLSYSLTVEKDCIFGKIGFSLNYKEIYTLTSKLFIYCINNNINNITLGYDSSKWSRLFIETVVAPILTERGLQCFKVDKPCPIFQLSWLTNQKHLSSKENCLGIYLSKDWYFSDVISIYLRNNEGEHLTEKEIKTIIALEDTSKTVDLNPFVNQPKPININLEMYLQYLIDQKLIDPSLKGNLFVDCMYGGIEYTLLPIPKYLKQLNIKLFNLESGDIRIKNYSPLPTGDTLKWRTKEVKENKGVYVAIDNDGDSLGVWDLHQKKEISSSGVYILLLYLLRDKYKRKGTVLISKMLSDKVSKIAKKLGLNVEMIDGGNEFISVLRTKRRSGALMYGDEKGRFWFKGDIKECNPLVTTLKLVELISTYNKNLSEILDTITEKHLKKTYPYIKMFLPITICNKDTLVENLKNYYKNKILNIDKGQITVIRLEKEIKIAVQESLKQKSVEVFLESSNKQTTLSTEKEIRDLFINEEENESTVSRINLMPINNSKDIIS